MLIASTALISVQSSLAASGSWTGTNSGTWSDAGNWSASPAPGSTSVTTNTDIATFNSAGNGNTTLTIDLNRNLRTINFDTSTTSYTIGAGGANGGNALRLSSSGAISLLATATGTNLTQTFNASLTLYGTATFTNARADTGSALVFAGNITNAAASTLTLSGAGTGTGNLISGNITDGVGVQSLTNSSTAGKWTLSGANSYSGLTSITGAGSTTVMQGSNSSAGATTLNNATATLQLNSASNGGLASGLLTLTAGRLEALNATRSLSNAVTMTAVTIQGNQSLTLNGKLTGQSAGNRTLTNNLSAGKTLTLSDIDINPNTAATQSLTIAGTGDTTVGGTIANGNGTTANSLTISNTGTTTLSGANTYSGTTTMNAAAGTLVLSGSNSSAGATTLTTGTLQLNNASNGGLASGTLTLTAGTVQALNATRTLSNAVTLGSGPVTISGDQSLTLNGKLTSAGFRNLTNNLAAGKLLTLSDVDITSDAGSGRVLTFLGTGNTTITGVIANGAGATTSGFANGGTGTITLKGDSTYTGATTFSGGTTILDGLGGTATLNSASTLIFGGGGFVFNGDNSGTGQTLGNVTVNAVSGSRLKVVAGSAGTTLALGTIAQNNEGGILNINLDSTAGAAAATTTSTMTNDLFSRAFVTVTTGGVTEFATKTGSNITAYTGQTAFVTTGASSSVNYSLLGSSSVTAPATLQVSTLRINTNATGQSLDLNGKTLQLANSGLLFVGDHDYEIKDTAGTGAFNGGGSNAQMNIHHFGDGTLTISAAIVSPSGTSTLSIDGPGTTVLSGVNLYTGNSFFGGGATVSIGASSALGSSASARTINLNNATLRATNTFTLDNGANARLIALAANGGTIDVTAGKTLTAPGVISGAGSLAKTGAGTFEVSAVNTYTGATTVNAGTLLVSGSGSINTTTGPIAVTAATAKLRYDSSVALTANIAVTNGGTFAYNSSSNYTGAFTFTNGKLGGTNWNGALAGLTIGANQTITPGNSVGAATSTTQTWAGGGSYDFEINKADGTAGLTAGGWDLLTLSGALNITASTGSKFNLNVISLGLDNLVGNATGFVNTSNYAWLLTDTGSTITSFAGSLFAINTTGFSNANSGIWALALGNTGGIGGTDQQLYLTYTAAIPEPSTYAALLGAFGLLLASVRRRRNA